MKSLHNIHKDLCFRCLSSLNFCGCTLYLYLQIPILKTSGERYDNRGTESGVYSRQEAYGSIWARCCIIGQMRTHIFQERSFLLSFHWKMLSE